MTQQGTEDDRTKPAGDTGEQEMRDLSERLQEARQKAGLDRPPSEPVPPLSLASYALRLATELVAGVVVGAAVGWAIDRALDSSPFGLILCFTLGFAAGMLNVVRAVRKLNAQQASAHPAATPAAEDEDED